MRRTMLWATAFVAVGLAAAPPSRAEASPADKGVVLRTLPGIVVDTKAGEVRLEGKVVQRDVSLELVVCTEGTREHESVIATKAKPSHVTFALAMLGLKEGKPGYMTPGGAFSPPAGDVLDLTVRFTLEKVEGGEKKTEVREVPAWKLLRLSGAETGLVRPIEWVYVGQQGRAALEAADSEGTIVCLSNFSTAVIDVPFESTDVNANLLYEANAEVIPARGTAAELVVRPTGRRIEPKKVEIEVVLKKDQPPVLDGRPLGLEAFREAVNATPAEIRTVVLRADPDERFGRVMEVHDVLRDALMRVTLLVLKGPKPPQAGAPPVQIAVTAGDRVRVGNLTMSLEDLKRKAADLLKGAEHATIVPEKGASWKTVADVMAILREAGVTATVSAGDAPKPPAAP